MSEYYETFISGTPDCDHASWIYYHSAMGGDYGVCRGCGLHRWYDELPDGVEIVDLDDYDDDEYESELEDESPAPMPTQERLDAWVKASGDWKA